MNPNATEVEAIIVVPYVGTYRYVGRSDGGPESSQRIADALARVTRPAGECPSPYDGYGVRMYGTDPSDVSLRESTFGTVDRETFEGEIYEHGDCYQITETTRKMRDQTSRKMALICDVFSFYGGVYVREWHFNRIGNGVRDSERPYLEN